MKDKYAGGIARRLYIWESINRNKHMGVFRLFVNHDKKDSFVNRLRRRRFSLLKDKIELLAATKNELKILDIGGDISYWKHIGWENPRSVIYLLNLYENTIPEKDAGQFRAVVGNAAALPFSRGDFDLVFSNSVIEHMGSPEKQEEFAKEVVRISDKYIIQTPSFWFPLEPHSLIPFFQFIPHRLRARLIMRFDINYFPKAATYEEALTVSRSTIMLTRKQFSKLFPDAQIQVERLFGIPKSYTAIKL
jgi:hypothetical protein